MNARRCLWGKLLSSMISNDPGADLAFFQGGGVWPIVHEPRSGEPILFGYFTSRKAASRFFWRFYEPRSGEPIFFGAILRAAKRRADFFGYFYEPRSGEPIFWGLFWTPVSDVFLASTNAMETMITSLAAQWGGGGGGGGVKPYCLRLSLRQSAIGTYCVGLDILWWRFFYAH